MNRRIAFLCACLLATLATQAQTLTGKLLDENNQPLPYANIVLLSLPDSAFVAGCVSADDGTFRLNASCDRRVIRISSIGYATLYKECTGQDLGTLQLQPDARMLGEVVVKADLPKVRLKGDAQVTTVQGSILEKAGTGNDLLNKLPGVSADDGAVNVFGSGAAEIYINGRKMRDASELDQLESENIKRVEVVRNPGARYNAEVKAVVRIYTKRPQGEGFGVNNRFLTRYQYDWIVLDQFNFNYRKGGFDLSGMLFGSAMDGENNKTMTTETFLDKTWLQVSDLRTNARAKNLSTMLSLNYQFNDRHSIGARYDFDRTPEEQLNIDPMHSLVYQDNVLYEENISRGVQPNPATSHSLNVYYNGQAGDWSIDFNADGLWSYIKMMQDMTEQYTPAGGTLQEQRVTTYNKDENTLYAAKLIVSRPLWEGSLSFGGEYTYTNRENTFLNDQGILADNLSNIEENAASAFLEYSRAFGQLQAQAGVRYEHITSDYYEGGTRVDEQSRKYDNVFPTLGLSLPVGKAQLSLSYSGSIYRPAYYMLRSNITYANRYTYEGGNPLLRPSIIQRLSLDASWKWIYFNARYTHAKDAIVNLGTSYSEDDPTIMLLSYFNKYDSDKLYATLNFSPTIGIWSPQLTLMLLQQWYRVDMPDGTRKNFNNPMGSFNWRNNFRLPWGLLLDVDASLDTPGDNENVYVGEVGWAVNVSLRKAFCNERLSLQLQGTDLFNSRDAWLTAFGGNRTLTLDQESRRSFTLTLRYKFNPSKSKYKGTGAGQEQRSRM